MIERISESVWKYKGNGNIYFLDTPKKIIIDTGCRSERSTINQFLSKIIDFSKVDIVIFTHLHYDHTGNFDLFPNAFLYASKNAIESFEIDPFGTILNKDLSDKFKFAKLNKLPEKIDCLEVIETPGHTKGSVCLFYPDEKVLFSGDTLFHKKNIGRTDLPSSAPEKMQESLVRLLNCPYKILCPGHDY
ncbi:MAG: MBL fold metallo-hydrolase [archaeon]